MSSTASEKGLNQRISNRLSELRKRLHKLHLDWSTNTDVKIEQLRSQGNQEALLCTLKEFEANAAAFEDAYKIGGQELVIRLFEEVKSGQIANRQALLAATINYKRQNDTEYSREVRAHITNQELSRRRDEIAGLRSRIGQLPQPMADPLHRQLETITVEAKGRNYRKTVYDLTEKIKEAEVSLGI